MKKLTDLRFKKSGIIAVLIFTAMFILGPSVVLAESIKLGAVLPLTGWGAAEGGYVLDGAYGTKSDTVTVINGLAPFNYVFYSATFQ